MAEDSLIADEFRDKIGVEWQIGAYEIERGMIQQFARAIDDPNPLWQDEEYARQSQQGGIIAPPTFVVTIGGEEFGQIVARLFRDGVLHGSTELECYRPVRPGDCITVVAKVANIRERHGADSGKTVFVIFEITYTNQRRELVARCRQTMIGYETVGAENA